MAETALVFFFFSFFFRPFPAGCLSVTFFSPFSCGLSVRDVVFFFRPFPAGWPFPA
jgi:hypothetical protein